ncbi:MAG: HIT domain-containing protein [bacterium]|nr:HIT domain-containing protein [bacterium]
MAKSFVDINNAKRKDYKKVISRIKLDKKCPFCPENFRYHKKPILKRKNNWFLTENSWPYKNSRYHFIICPKKHKETISELTKADMESVIFLAGWAIRRFRIKGGGLMARFGDSRLSGTSVTHLHFHIVSPQENKKTGRAKAVFFPIG